MILSLNSQLEALETLTCGNPETNDCFNPLSAIPTKLSNTLKQFAGYLLTNCLNVFDHFVVLAPKELSTT